MNRQRNVLLCVCALMTALAGVCTAQAVHPVMMVSIDGLRPDYVTEAEKHHLHLPILSSFLTQGSYAEGVLNVVPTVTYPNHTTLVTGVWPIEHGISNNTVFDPTGQEQGAWNWYASQIKVATLWDAAKAKGLITASVLWPVTVHSPSIDYNIPEYWRTRTESDHYVLEAVSTPSGYLEELERKTGPFSSRDGGGLGMDELVTQAAIEIINNKHPDLLTIHLVSLDHIEHAHGPFSPEANSNLESIDKLLGRLIEAERAVHPDAAIAVVSDHGFLPVSKRVNVNAAFVNHGLITVADQPKPHVTDWKAFSWGAGGSAIIVLKNPDDQETVKKTEELLHELANDSANGVAQVLNRKEAREMGATPEASFVVDWKSGFESGSSLSGPIVEPVAPGGTHGYLPTHPELHSSFFLAGPGIAAGKNLGVIDMRQIAPTLARELGVDLPTAAMAPLDIRGK